MSAAGVRAKPQAASWLTATDRATLDRLAAKSGGSGRSRGIGRPAVGEGGGSPTVGGVDFFDYRGYQRGDDLRRVDWRVLARTGKWWVRRGESPGDRRWLVVLDGSASMSASYDDSATLRPALPIALRVAAGVAYLAQRRGEQARLQWAGGTNAASPRDGAFVDVLHRSAGDTDAPHHRTHLAEAIAAAARTPGSLRLVLVSDLLEPRPGVVSAISRAVQSGASAVVVRVEAESPADASAGAEGLSGVQWVEAETGRRLAAADLTDEQRERWRHAVADDRRDWRRAVQGRGATYVEAAAEADDLSQVWTALI